MSQHDADSKIEYEPHDDPDVQTDDGYAVYTYPPENGIVPDVIVTTTDGDERFRLWFFQGHNGMAVLAVHTDHKHPPDYPDGECRKWSVYDDDGFPDISEAPDTPDRVTDLAMRYTDAPVADKAGSGEAG